MINFRLVRHLWLFLAVAEERHFGRAARRLGMTQPPLTEQIKVLEHALRVKLFDRTPKGVQLTPAGQAILPAVRRLADHLEHLELTVREAAAGQVGVLTIGAITSAMLDELPRVIERLKLSHPGVTVSVREIDSADAIPALESGELAKLDVKDKALLAQDRTIAASQMQLEQLNKLPARWPLEQGYRQLRQLDALWPDNPQVRALNVQWRKQRELSALSAEALNGYAQAQSQLQRLSAQLDALDERKGRYLTGSELKTAVYGIRQSLKEPPLEELLRQLEEQKQTGEVSPTLLTQIDTRLNQLLNRYVILLDTKVEQSQ